MIQIYVAIWGYWQDELISVILKMHNLIVTTYWGRDQMATVLQTSNAHIDRGSTNRYNRDLVL